MDAAVLIPIKAFHEAKGRLSPVLGAADRERLARFTASGVLDASRDWTPHVICDDDAVAEWAHARGAVVLRDAGNGLNAAVDAGVAHLADAGFGLVVVVHGDLPLAAGLGDLIARCRPDGVTLVPDRRLDGTNVMALPARSAIRASYGAGSYRLHLSAAMAAGLAVTVVRDAHLALDIDQPADLDHPWVRPIVDTVVNV